ncbi:hypothetical protein [Streptosporangium sp. KLBMP 9127]
MAVDPSICQNGCLELAGERDAALTAWREHIAALAGRLTGR